MHLGTILDQVGTDDGAVEAGLGSSMVLSMLRLLS